ncbi:hypothetical protein BGZ80_003306 [Entomortierella chlamydospora]|uniref:Uncharacterized protein n=1 Tax=Entomortierella chlamydospora TaxID=101097 RepID=A0A9P6N217_9FUNG|nr:hypothetical protein BGZ79_006573 [Entomortierella chlamydospora]KAG0020941.1 hypothetical protein BGZ80_003306 [Entomortierella chlamydospora]
MSIYSFLRLVARPRHQVFRIPHIVTKYTGATTVASQLIAPEKMSVASKLREIEEFILELSTMYSRRDCVSPADTDKACGHTKPCSTSGGGSGGGDGGGSDGKGDGKGDGNRTDENSVEIELLKDIELRLALGKVVSHIERSTFFQMRNRIALEREHEYLDAIKEAAGAKGESGQYILKVVLEKAEKRINNRTVAATAQLQEEDGFYKLTVQALAKRAGYLSDTPAILRVLEKVGWRVSSRWRSQIVRIKEEEYLAAVAEASTMNGKKFKGAEITQNTIQMKIGERLADIRKEALENTLKGHGLNMTEYSELWDLGLNKNSRVNPNVKPYEVAQTLARWRQKRDIQK